MKTPSNKNSCRALSGVALLTSLLLAACASAPAPTAQVAVSAAAVSSAGSAGGAEAAPLEMQLAREKLERAKVAMSSKDYKVARSLAQEAQVDAQLAEAKARSGKAREAAGELQQGIRVLREELERKAQ